MILLDTHVIAWLALDPSRISKNARVAIDEARAGVHGIAIAGISLFELARMSAKERMEFSLNPEAFLSEVERMFVVIPINAQISMRSLTLPASYPRDPADRIIGSTALVEGIPLITADRGIRKSRAFTTVW